MRLVSYSLKGLLAGTRSSMLPTDDSLLSVKLVHSTTTYWPNGMTKTLDSGDSEDELEVKFAISGVTIASGSSIQVLVTGIINPPSTVPLKGFKMNFFTSVNYGNSATTSTQNYLQIGYFNTCDRLLTEQASANAILGYHTVGLSAAQYRFRFRTANTYPNKSGLQVTMPSGYSLQSAGFYTLTCLAGCTASYIAATKANSNVLTFADCFEGQLTSGAVVDLIISGWQNPVTESVMRVSFATVWDTSADYTIDKFENLGALQSSQSLKTSTTFDSTNLLITSESDSCIVREPQRVLAALATSSDARIVTVETASQKFESMGAACKGRESFTFVAHAESSSGKHLNQRYATTSVDSSGLIQVILTAAYDTASAAEDHAVYVLVTDGASQLSQNHFCFMVNKSPSTINFCRSYCLGQQLHGSVSAKTSSLYYTLATAPTSSPAVAFTDELTQVSQNPVMCPVLYAGNTPAAKTHSQSDQAVKAFDSRSGRFTVQTDNAAMVLAYGLGQENYIFTAATPAYTRSTSLTIYFQACKSAAHIVAIANTKIEVVLKVDSQATFNGTQLGFTSSDPVSCPLGSAINATYSFATPANGSSLASYWTQSGGVLTVRRDSATVLDAQVSIVVSATDSSGFTIKNTVTLVIKDCASAWGCASCDASLIFDSRLTAVSQSAIKERTSGCTSCPPTHYLTYKADSSGKYFRQCELDPYAAFKAGVGQACGLGMVYALTASNLLQCTQPCSATIKGCSLCSSSTYCTLCDNAALMPSKFIDAYGATYSACTDFCLDCGVVSCPTNCAVCSNTGSVCLTCKSGFFMSGGECTAISGKTTKSFFVKKATANKVYFDVAAINSETGTSADSQFSFLQQVFNAVYSDISLRVYQKVTVTVTLEKGDHFFFSCHKDLYASYSATYSSSDFTDLCQGVPALRQISPPADNFEFIFNAAETTGTVVNVLDSYVNFNITGSMTFNNIEFRGEHALAVPSRAPLAHPPLATLPIKKCEVQTAPDGSHKQLFLLSSEAVSYLVNRFKCTDSGFQEATVPMTAKESCVQGVQSSSVESVRACPGEPYHADFFTQDSASKIYYKRHRVLFNLYNWDVQRSYSRTSRATLTLNGCKFMYFLADYEALILVQTNNMAFSKPSGLNPFIEELGDNRGVIIKISASTFAHSRFCKGMLVFKKRPVIKTTNDLLVYSLSSSNSVEKESTDNSLIDISGSTFENLNFGRVLKTLSLLDGKTYPISGLSSVAYPAFDNHGSVLNLQGFPGGVKIADSIFRKNMVFIKDILPVKRSLRDEVELFRQYVNTNTGQVMTTRCNSTSIVRRLFSDYLNSLREQPSHELSQLEKHSPIYISGHENPIVFVNNQFEYNVGLFGGAVSLDTPNFVSGDFGYDLKYDFIFKAFAVFKKNTFQSNQAYLSGNAVYVRSTRQDSVAIESKQVCGAGIEFNTNSFVDNAPIIQASNGGAVSLECDLVSVEASAGVASNLFFADWSDQIQVYDPVVKGDSYFIYRYASVLTNNSFTGNSVGQKGSGIYSRQISFLIVNRNTFTVNGPAYSINRNARGQPYSTYLALKARSILFYEESFALVTDELDYMDKAAGSFAEGGLIDLPQSQGVIYYEQCRSCLVDFKIAQRNGSEKCKFCYSLPSLVLIEQNSFVNNFDSVAFFEEHGLPRASHIQADGGASFTIKGNNFNFQGAIFDALASTKLPSYTNFLPNEYFERQQTPVIRIKIHEGLDDFYADLKNSGNKELDKIYQNTTMFMPANVTIIGNLFDSAATVQPFVASQAFKGSLLQLESGTRNCIVNFENNSVDDSFSLGGEASLVYVEGAALSASKNLFRRVGLMNTQLQSFVKDKSLKSSASYFPVDAALWSSRTWTQEKGVFWIKGIRKGEDFFTPQRHSFVENEFSFIFCGAGCAVTHEQPDQGQPVYAEFVNNTYRDVYGLKGVILYSKVAQQTTAPGTYVIFNATLETIERVQNGAYLVEGQRHETMLIMQHINMTDVFGDEHQAAFANLSKGALFICKFCSFLRTLASQDKVVTTQFVFERAKFSFRTRERDTFYEYLNRQTAEVKFQPSDNQAGALILDSLSMDFVPSLGAIKVDPTTLGLRLNYTYNEDPFISQGVYQNATTAKWYPRNNATMAQSNWNLGIPDFFPHSLISNSSFSNVKVREAFIHVSGAKLEMRSTNLTMITATGNNSTVVHAKTSKLVLKENVLFLKNEADSGAAVRLTHAATLEANKTSFSQNLARTKAGAIMAIDESTFTLANCSFWQNEAPMAGAIAVENVLSSPVQIFDSFFRENRATQNLIQLTLSRMMISNSTFLDNVAEHETPGISISLSQLTVLKVTVKVTKKIEPEALEPEKAPALEPTPTSTNNTNTTSPSSEPAPERSADPIVDNSGPVYIQGQASESAPTGPLYIDPKSQQATGNNTSNGRLLRVTTLETEVLKDEKLKEIAEQVEREKMIERFNSNTIKSRRQIVAGFFYSVDSSTLLIQDSNLSGTYGEVASAIYTSSESQLYITGLTASNIKGPKKCEYETAGVIVGSMASLIDVKDTTISDSGCSYIFSDRTPVVARGIHFTSGYESPYIRVMGSQLEVSESVFSAALQIDPSVKGRAINCDLCTKLNVTGSQFNDLQAYQGGAVFVKNSANGTLQNNSFTGNLARQGGAIYLQNSDLKLFENDFQSNRAESSSFDDKLLRNVLVVVTDISTGGGVFFTCVNPEDSLLKYAQTSANITACFDGISSSSELDDLSQNCEGKENVTKELDLVIGDTNAGCRLQVDGNTFVNNTAETRDSFGNRTSDQLGNNIFFTNKQLQDKKGQILNCSQAENAFLPECQFLRSPPSRIKLHIGLTNEGQNLGDYLDEDYARLQDLAWEDPTSRVARIQGRISLNSGSAFNLDILMYDAQGNEFNIPQGVRAELKFLDESQPNFYQIQEGIAVAADGKLSFRRTKIFTRPGATIYLQVVFSSIDGWFDKTPFLKHPPLFILSARSCRPGEFYDTQNMRRSCQPCNEGTYSFKRQLEATPNNSCPACPQNAVCEEGGEIYPAHGHTRMHKDSQLFIQCFNEDACKEGDEEKPFVNCAAGYTGVMCATCKSSHWKPKNTFLCYECDSAERHIFVYSFQTFIAVLIMFCMYRQNMRNFKLPHQEGLAIYRIVVNQFHLLYIVNAMQDSEYYLGNYQKMKMIMDALSSWFNPFGSLAARDCLGVDDQAANFYTQVIIWVSVPPTLICFNALILFVATKLAKAFGQSNNPNLNWQKLVNRLAVISGSMLYFVYPNIIETLLQSVNCFPSLSTEGPTDVEVSRLRVNPDIDCHSDEYRVYFWSLCVPGILLYVIIVPLVALFYLCKWANYVYLSSEPTVLQNNQKDLRTINWIKSLYGFFFAGLNLGSHSKRRGLETSSTSQETGEVVKPTCHSLVKKILRPLTDKGVELKVTRGKKINIVQTHFYWEFVVHFEKTILLVAVTFMGDYNNGNQICIMVLLIIIFQVVQQMASPYATSTLNRLQTFNLTIVQLFLTFRMIIRSFGVFDDKKAHHGSTTVTGVLSNAPIAQELVERRRIIEYVRGEGSTVGIVVIFFAFYLFVMLYVCQQLYIHCLLYLVKRERKDVFRWLTCGRFKPQEFVRKYSTQEEVYQNPDDVLNEEFVKQEEEKQKKMALIRLNRRLQSIIEEDEQQEELEQELAAQQERVEALRLAQADELATWLSKPETKKLARQQRKKQEQEMKSRHLQELRDLERRLENDAQRRKLKEEEDEDSSDEGVGNVASCAPHADDSIDDFWQDDDRYNSETRKLEQILLEQYRARKEVLPEAMLSKSSIMSSALVNDGPEIAQRDYSQAGQPRRAQSQLTHTNNDVSNPLPADKSFQQLENSSTFYREKVHGDRNAVKKSDFYPDPMQQSARESKVPEKPRNVLMSEPDDDAFDSQAERLLNNKKKRNSPQLTERCGRSRSNRDRFDDEMKSQRASSRSRVKSIISREDDGINDSDLSDVNRHYPKKSGNKTKPRNSKSQMMSKRTKQVIADSPKALARKRKKLMETMKEIESIDDENSSFDLPPVLHFSSAVKQRNDFGNIFKKEQKNKNVLEGGAVPERSNATQTSKRDRSKDKNRRRR